MRNLKLNAEETDLLKRIVKEMPIMMEMGMDDNGVDGVNVWTRTDFYYNKTNEGLAKLKADIIKMAALADRILDVTQISPSYYIAVREDHHVEYEIKASSEDEARDLINMGKQTPINRLIDDWNIIELKEIKA